MFNCCGSIQEDKKRHEFRFLTTTIWSDDEVDQWEYWGILSQHEKAREASTPPNGCRLESDAWRSRISVRMCDFVASSKSSCQQQNRKRKSTLPCAFLTSFDSVRRSTLTIAHVTMWDNISSRKSPCVRSTAVFVPSCFGFVSFYNTA
eukprot:scaffold3227_cov214-Amphora_coffeaeformis.AAC.5